MKVTRPELFVLVPTLLTQVFTMCFAPIVRGAAASVPLVLRPPVVVSQGPHEQTFEYVTATEVNGEQIVRTNSYVQLGTGMNVWSIDEQKWLPASDEIEIAPGGVGAFARKAQHKVFFAPRLLSEPDGTVDVLLPDGKQRLKSRVAGIALTDRAAGISMFLAETRDTGAELEGKNRIVYPRAFDGIDADIRYSMTAASFEQDIVVHQQIELGGELLQAGFKPETAMVEIWTEFTTETPPRRGGNQVDGKELEGDERLDFGPNSMFFGPSQAYQTDDGEAPTPARPAQGGAFNFHRKVRMPVEWATLGGKQFLIESMPLAEFQALAVNLPKLQANALPQRAGLKVAGNFHPKTTGRTMPMPLARRPISRTASSEYAQVTLRAREARPAVVCDYVLISGAADYRFAGGTTYYITNNAYFYGNTVLEGGAVLKFDLLDPNLSHGTPRVLLWGPISCETSAYRPAVFTAKDDNTFGETLPFSTGNPGTNYYAYEGLVLWDLGEPAYIHDVRFYHALIGFGAEWRQQTEVRHAQFVNCYYSAGGYQATVNLRNALSYNAFAHLAGTSSTLTVENGTFDQGVQLVFNNGGSSFALTNCVITGIQDTTGYSGANNRSFPSSDGVYEKVFGGHHYLPAGSPIRKAGTMGVSPALLADLTKRTTSAPLVLENTIVCDTVLERHVARGAGTPDCGYYYDPLDYITTGLAMTNVTVRMMEGVSIASYNNGTLFFMAYGAKVYGDGTPLKPIEISSYRLVQETGPGGNAGTFYLSGYSPGPPQEVHLRFCNLGLGAATFTHHVFAMGIPMAALISFHDCDVGSRRVWVYDSPTVSVELRNCRFGNVFWGVSAHLQCYNSLWRGGTAYFWGDTGQTYSIKDNLFDKSTISNGGSGTAILGNNGYATGFSRLTPQSSSDIVYPGNPTFEQGPLGPFYLPINGPLADVGSRLASEAGLYHYTTRASQSPEANSQVDVGFHYVAVDGTGQPLDTDGDGLPNYVEDANGNGIYEPELGETDWQTSNSLVSGPSSIQVFTPME